MNPFKLFENIFVFVGSLVLLVAVVVYGNTQCTDNGDREYINDGCQSSIRC